MRRLLVILLFIFFSAPWAVASRCPSPPVLEKEIRKVFPRARKLKVERVSPAPLPGFCQVLVDLGGPFKRMVYVDSRLNYLLVGQLINLKTRENITRRELSRYLRLKPEELKRLESLVAFTEGRARKFVYLVTDPDCPFCKRLEKTLKKFVDRGQLTVRVILMPLSKLHPGAEKKAIALICDRKGLKELISGYTSGNLCPEGKKKVAESINYLRRLGIRSTPTLILPDGRLIQGALPEPFLARVLGITPGSPHRSSP